MNVRTNFILVACVLSFVSLVPALTHAWGYGGYDSYYYQDPAIYYPYYPANMYPTLRPYYTLASAPNTYPSAPTYPYYAYPTYAVQRPYYSATSAYAPAYSGGYPRMY